MGRKIEATTNYITTLILVSDNYTDGIDNINPILDKVNVWTNYTEYMMH